MGARLHYLFRPPYQMEPHGSKESGLNWDDGFIHCSQVQTVLTEALAPFNHLYSRGEGKCLLLLDILGRAIEDLESLECPKPTELKSDIHCHLPCYSFQNMQCALRNADREYSWLQYHITYKTFIKCPPNNTRHTAEFSLGVPKPNTVMKPSRLFQRYISGRQGNLQTIYFDMSARKRTATTDAQTATVGGGDPDTDPGSYTEATSLLFDPNMVLLRRVFFLDPDKKSYISIGYYPSRNYQPLVEIGSPKQHPILLTDHHVSTLAEHLGAQVDALWREELYTVRDADFSMHSATPYKTAILTFGVKQNKKSVPETTRTSLSELHFSYGCAAAGTVHRHDG